eukprot:2661802-Lingulodinium_polyedra.AAC.1
MAPSGTPRSRGSGAACETPSRRASGSPRARRGPCTPSRRPGVCRGRASALATRRRARASCRGS